MTDVNGAIVIDVIGTAVALAKPRELSEIERMFGDFNSLKTN